MQFLYELINNDTFKILGIVIGMDLIFGILRAIREKNINSCIGIDGMIRKCRNVNCCNIFKFNR